MFVPFEKGTKFWRLAGHLIRSRQELGGFGRSVVHSVELVSLE
jgi:hypothetical protein